MDFSAIKNWAPETFVERMLAGELRAKALCCGFNFRFGKDAVGTTADLSRIAKNHGMVVRVANPIDYDGQAISSTRIREALQQGDMVSADAMLGRPFSFDFPVVSGDRRGRLLGAPTLNQPFPEDYMLPRFGVYASLAFVEGRWHTAVTNLGIRPTVQSPIPLAETCILNYKGDLYGQRVEVALIRFIRPEKKFDSFEALSKAIHEDAQTATQMIKEDGRFGAFHTGHTV